MTVPLLGCLAVLRRSVAGLLAGLVPVAVPCSRTP
ncbi:hypothetical protein QF034_001112 [Streptomyces africanus]|uniref:Uncharacterized protein n=1 Tax=Streptomyces africanus TaxID=231024 RepID=A0ABU0QHM5_9ACTN|nr:hypothetical protein [Streptomyces africanus]